MGRRLAQQEGEMAARQGFTVNLVNGQDLRNQDPAFTESVQGAVHYPESAFLDPGLFLPALARRLGTLGVDLREKVTVSRLVVKGQRCLGVLTDEGQQIFGSPTVLAAGIWSSHLAKAAGVSLPMQAGKGYYLDLTPPVPCPQTACVLTEAFVAVTPMEEKLRLAGTVELSGINDRLVPRRLAMLKQGAGKYLRGLDQVQVLNEGCALRPCTADGLPVVGWAPGIEGLFLATGHAKMGLTHGPITGRLASECLLEGPSTLDLFPLRPDRLG
jgi:D-amino-acid dehydrogenase